MSKTWFLVILALMISGCASAYQHHIIDTVTLGKTTFEAVEIVSHSHEIWYKKGETVYRIAHTPHGSACDHLYSMDTANTSLYVITGIEQLTFEDAHRVRAARSEEVALWKRYFAR